MKTPYAGGLLHIELRFPTSYPQLPPSAIILGPPVWFPHPDVHGNRICVDLLSDFSDFFGEINDQTGWLPGYGVAEILVQLQQFLTNLPHISDDALPLYLDKIPDALRKSREYSCSTCPHTPENQWPPFSSSRLLPSSQVIQKTELETIGEELCCFHTKKTYKEDIIGIPVTVFWNQRRQITDIKWNLDLLSYSAFSDGQTTGSMNQPFSHWIPLIINKEHGERVESDFVAEKCISYIVTGKPDRFTEDMVLEVLPALMNSMIVDFSRGSQHYSIKFLQGYCYVHRLLLRLVAKYPNLLKQMNILVKNFTTNERSRHKSVVPDLGKFLTYLTVTDMTWENIAGVYMFERFDRSVGRALQKCPWLQLNHPRVNAVRNEATFYASKVGSSLLMFQVYFLKNVARPSGVSLQTIAQNYDERLGRPEPEVCDKLQGACREIKAVSSWEDFFSWIGLKSPPESELRECLRRSIDNSLRRKYRYPLSTPVKLPPEEFFQQISENPSSTMGNLIAEAERQLSLSQERSWTPNREEEEESSPHRYYSRKNYERRKSFKDKRERAHQTLLDFLPEELINETGLGNERRERLGREDGEEERESSESRSKNNETPRTSTTTPPTIPNGKKTGAVIVFPRRKGEYGQIQKDRLAKRNNVTNPPKEEKKEEQKWWQNRGGPQFNEKRKGKKTNYQSGGSYSLTAQESPGRRGNYYGDGNRERERGGGGGGGVANRGKGKGGGEGGGSKAIPIEKKTNKKKMKVNEDGSPPYLSSAIQSRFPYELLDTDV